MGHKPTLSYSNIRRKLRKLGFVKNKGKKHEKWKHPDGRIVMLSRGNRDAGDGLIAMVCSQAQISVEDFMNI